MTKNSEKLPKWDLSDLYPNIKSTEVDFAKLAKKVRTFCKEYEGKISALSAQNLYKAIAEYESITELSQKLGSYAGLLFAADMLNEKIAGFYQNTQEKLTENHSALVFFTHSLILLDDKKIKSPALKKYAPWLRDIRASRPHLLSEEMEKFEIDKSIVSNSAWQKLFDETHASLKYNFGGNELSNAEIFHKFSDKNRKTREKAGHSVAKTLESNSKLFASITNNLAKDKSISDKWRKFPRPISSRNLSNLVEDEIVDTLISTVRANYKNLSHRYFKIKAKWMGLTKLEYWDRNAPLPGEDDSYIPYKDAQKIVIDAYFDFSPHMSEIIAKFFDANWIDVPPRKGKDSGAFAHPVVPSVHPYLLINYQGKIGDVMTLAHELGHGVHQYLAREQGALLCDTPLTLAETASVFGEQLVFRALLEAEKNKKKRKIMIAGKIEDMLNTVVRQVAFCEFERIVHDERRGGELSVERICEIWMEQQKLSLGPAFNYHKEYKYFWSYIPHFIHSPFYVYAYAFGDCLVNSLYAVYQEKPKGFEERYIQMLKAGGSLRHGELLRPFGLNAKKPDFWQKGLNVIDKFITELEEEK